MSGKTTAEPTTELLDIEEAELRLEAFALMDSMRGRYILSQALHYGIQELEKVPVPYQETSNLEDMTLLRQELFNFPIEDNGNAIAKAKEEGLI